MRRLPSGSVINNSRNLRKLLGAFRQLEWQPSDELSASGQAGRNNLMSRLSTSILAYSAHSSSKRSIRRNFHRVENFAFGRPEQSFGFLSEMRCAPVQTSQLAMQAVVNLAKSAQEKGDWKKAYEYAHAVLGHSNHEIYAKEGLGPIDLTPCKDIVRDAWSFALGDKKYQKAIDILNDNRRLHSESTFVHNLLVIGGSAKFKGQAYYAISAYSSAYSAAVTSKDPKVSELSYMPAEALLTIAQEAAQKDQESIAWRSLRILRVSEKPSPYQERIDSIIAQLKENSNVNRRINRLSMMHPCDL